MKRDVTEILDAIAPNKAADTLLPSIQRLSLMRKWTERRLWRREKVRIPVVLATGEEKRIAVVIDISAKGLRLSGVDKLAVDRMVTISMRGFAPLEGKIVWTKGNQAGVLLSRNLLD